MAYGKRTGCNVTRGTMENRLKTEVDLQNGACGRGKLKATNANGAVPLKEGRIGSNVSTRKEGHPTRCKNSKEQKHCKQTRTLD